MSTEKDTGRLGRRRWHARGRGHPLCPRGPSCPQRLGTPRPGPAELGGLRGSGGQARPGQAEETAAVPPLLKASSVALCVRGGRKGVVSVSPSSSGLGRSLQGLHVGQGWVKPGSQAAGDAPSLLAGGSGDG